MNNNGNNLIGFEDNDMLQF